MPRWPAQQMGAGYLRQYGKRLEAVLDRLMLSAIALEGTGGKLDVIGGVEVERNLTGVEQFAEEVRDVVVKTRGKGGRVKISRKDNLIEAGSVRYLEEDEKEAAKEEVRRSSE